MKFKQYFSDRSNTLLPNIIGDDVLSSKDARDLRKHDLKRAVILGTTYNLESSIEYIDSSGRSMIVISRVIALSQENAILQNDRIIPITMISKVVV
ncbi:MAG: hypothetical protein HRT61_24220 [Ekhidna sp.]|nr:hypothetical protein [Ekhidna sp.]